jgi:hypothetical protein
MAAVYKSLARQAEKDNEDENDRSDLKRNKQRVLILSSRGVTYRYLEPRTRMQAPTK